jgi:hypothetical protein
MNTLLGDPTTIEVDDDDLIVVKNLKKKPKKKIMN